MAIGDGWVDGSWVDAGWVTAAEPGGAWSVGAVAVTTEVRQVFPPMANNVVGGARGGLGPDV